jgi:hypothetical protein
MRSVGGRRLHVGYRPTFHYEGESDQGYLILPVAWFTADGALLTEADEPPEEFTVTMTILDDSYRKMVHWRRIDIGTRFEWREGFQVVATGEVTRILGLFEP